MRVILVVDDSASMRQMVTFTLKSSGFEVIEAIDGQDALDKLGDRSIDLVLTDQNMPRMDGLGLIRNLRALMRFQGTPILMLTTESGDEMKQAGRAAGATGWLVKPFDPVRLLQVIDKVLPRAVPQ
jgi:two-component system chemotaxis response regulator CheY